LCELDRGAALGAGVLPLYVRVQAVQVEPVAACQEPHCCNTVSQVHETNRTFLHVLTVKNAHLQRIPAISQVVLLECHNDRIAAEIAWFYSQFPTAFAAMVLELNGEHLQSATRALNPFKLVTPELVEQFRALGICCNGRFSRLYQFPAEILPMELLMMYFGIGVDRFLLERQSLL
jgi:hypothetical protein